MKNSLLLLLAAVAGLAAGKIDPGSAGPQGAYVEARSATVWGGGCHINAEIVTQERRALVGYAFDGGTFHGTAVAGVSLVAALEADGGEWARKQASILRTKSPQTIKVALRQLVEGATKPSFADNMAMEFGLACAVIRRPDFVEGVRAVIFDKDNAPRWTPATLEEVRDEMIDAIFAPLPPDRQWTPLPQLADA